jgi:hypothetical protein
MEYEYYIWEIRRGFFTIFRQKEDEHNNLFTDYLTRYGQWKGVFRLNDDEADFNSRRWAISVFKKIIKNKSLVKYIPVNER